MKTSLILTISIVFLYPLLVSSDYATLSGNDFKVFQTVENIMEEPENELELEDWMTNDNIWGLRSEWSQEETDQIEGEESLVIEAWMTDDNLWM